MDTQQFLELVWPQQGIYLLAIPASYTDTEGKTHKYFKHFAFNSIPAAVQHALALSNDREAPHDVFFALGTVKEDLTRTNKKDREAAGKKVRGVHRSGHDNTADIRAFWIDVDVDPHKTDAYPVREDAAKAIREFVQAMGLPKPLVTSSGGGYHVYWPLTESLDPDTWQTYANTLKALATSWGLKQDPSRTADRASILRPVGTNNWKTGQPRPVQVVVLSGAVDPARLLARLAYLAETARLPIQQPRQPALLGTMPGLPTGVAPAIASNTAALMSEALEGVGYEPPDPRKVVSKCAQLAWQAANQPAVPEPLWYAMVGLVRFTMDGCRAVHFMSRLSPLYDPVSTDAKIQQHMDAGAGPTLCSTFEHLRPGGCDGCPAKGKIKTPLHAVRELQQVAPPTVVVHAAGAQVQVSLPPPPKPFKRVNNPSTGQSRIAVTVGDKKTGTEEDVVIYEYDLFPCRLVFDERESRYNVVVKRWLPQDGWAEFQVPTGKLYDKKQLAMAFGDIGVWPDLANVEQVVQYMIGYIRDLNKFAQSSVIYAQLGWREELDRFILPDRVITKAGVEVITPAKNIVNTLSWKEAKGDLDDWKKIAAVYERPGLEAHQFGFGVGFASPLFIYTNFNGMIVSMVGKRGAGKSSSAMMANSIWGHPKMGWTDMLHDTQKAFYQKLGILKNLPATYDEHTNLDGETVSDLCYMVSKGQGRQRLRASAEAMENHGNYQLMMLMTGNTSLVGRLASAKADSSAEAARVFEYEVPEHTLTKAEADLYWGPGALIEAHYGVAAEVYARQLVVSQDWARDRVQHWVREIDRLASVSSGERFWSAGAACVLAGFELANACGLTNADVNRLLHFAVNVICGMRETVSETTRTPVSIVSDYFNSNLRSALILNSDGTHIAQPIMLHEPSDKLRIRYEKHRGALYIDRADFRRFCNNANVDHKTVEKELRGLNVLTSTNHKITLGKGTPYSGMQTICWSVSMQNPEVLGLGELAAVAPAAAGGTP